MISVVVHEWFFFFFLFCRHHVQLRIAQTTGTKEAAPKPLHRYRISYGFSTYVRFCSNSDALHYLVGLDFFALGPDNVSLLRRLLTGAIVIVIVLALAKSIEFI